MINEQVLKRKGAKKNVMSNSKVAVCKVAGSSKGAIVRRCCWQSKRSDGGICCWQKRILVKIKHSQKQQQATCTKGYRDKYQKHRL